jgi:pimeloyl-ACP methyl ester carboxylesterase
MAKLSRSTKEIIKTIIVLGIIAILVLVFVIYPLNKTKDIMGRPDIDDIAEDSLIINDPGAWAEAGLVTDTFRVEVDGLTSLACLFVCPDTTADTTYGTVILTHPHGADRDAVLPLAQTLLDSGWCILAADLRAAGRSSGSYRGEGQYEAEDFASLISYAEIHDQIRHPLVVVGFARGADGALIAAESEPRVDAVIAIDPYLSTDRALQILRRQAKAYWFPFYKSIMWWWYDIRSGYAAAYRTADHIEGVEKPTLLLMPEHDLDVKEVNVLRERSKADKLTVESLPPADDRLYERLVEYISALK